MNIIFIQPNNPQNAYFFLVKSIYKLSILLENWDSCLLFFHEDNEKYFQIWIYIFIGMFILESLPMNLVTYLNFNKEKYLC